MRNRLLYLILTFIGVLGILDTVLLLLFFNVSVNLGVTLPGLAGSLLVIYSLIKLFSTRKFEIRNRLLRRLVQVVLTLWLLSFIFIEGIIISGQIPDENVQTTYLLILGAGLNGEKPSPTLEERLKLGAHYLSANPDTKVIVSGGQGPDEDITEAEAMRRYLVNRGINEERIIKEEKSTSTIENLRLSKKIMTQDSAFSDTINNVDKPTDEIIIITSDFHMFRAKMLAKRAGLVPYGIPARTPYPVLPNSYLREYFAVIKSYLLDR